MATFTDTVLVSSVESAAVDSTIVGAQVGITLAPDIRALSSSETQETVKIEDPGPTSALEKQLIHKIG